MTVAFLGLVRGTVRLVPAHPDWARIAREHGEVLLALCRGLGARLEHIGSTAVAGLEAKPILDLILVVPGAAEVEEAVSRLGGLPGYLDRGPRDGSRLMVLETAPEVRVVHLHLLTRDHPGLADYLTFRDALRENGALRDRYRDLKRELWRCHGDDREAYTAGKAAFIAAVLAEYGQKK